MRKMYREMTKAHSFSSNSLQWVTLRATSLIGQKRWRRRNEQNFPYPIVNMCVCVCVCVCVRFSTHTSVTRCYRNGFPFLTRNMATNSSAFVTTFTVWSDECLKPAIQVHGRSYTAYRSNATFSNSWKAEFTCVCVAWSVAQSATFVCIWLLKRFGNMMCVCFDLVRVKRRNRKEQEGVAKRGKERTFSSGILFVCKQWLSLSHIQIHACVCVCVWIESRKRTSEEPGVRGGRCSRVWTI